MKVFRFAGVGAALLAVVAFSAMALASSASATVTFLLALWLENGVAVSVNTLVGTSGELDLENTKAPIVGNAGVLCSGELDGFVGPESKDEITEVLSLAGASISRTALTGTALSCTNQLNCESSKVYAVNLPWTSELELWEEGTEVGFVILLKSATGNVGWYVECTDLGVKASEECTTATAAANAKNVTGGVEGAFSSAFTSLMGLKLAECSGSKTETGEVTGSGLEKTSLAGPLEVSSE
jgi:hypothetical protein